MNTATIIGLIITGLSALAGIVVGVIKLIKDSKAKEEQSNSSAGYGMPCNTQGMSHGQIYASTHQPIQQQSHPVQQLVMNKPMPQPRPVVMPSADAVYTTTQSMNMRMYGGAPNIHPMNTRPVQYQQYAVQWTIPNTMMLIDHDQAQLGMDTYCNAMNRVAKRNQPLPEDVIDTVLAAAERQHRPNYYGNVQPV